MIVPGRAAVDISPISSEKPHRSMTFYGRKERVEILLYLTEVRKLDGAFTPEQFTPVHFINDRLLDGDGLPPTFEGGKEIRGRLSV